MDEVQGQVPIVSISLPFCTRVGYDVFGRIGILSSPHVGRLDLPKRPLHEGIVFTSSVEMERVEWEGARFIDRHRHELLRKRGAL
jgi:hypothetical protein